MKKSIKKSIGRKASDPILITSELCIFLGMLLLFSKIILYLLPIKNNKKIIQIEDNPLRINKLIINSLHNNFCNSIINNNSDFSNMDYSIRALEVALEINNIIKLKSN